MALPGRYNANIRQVADGKRYVMIFFEQNMAEIHFLFVILQFVPYLHIHIWEIDYQQHIDTTSSSEAEVIMFTEHIAAQVHINKINMTQILNGLTNSVVYSLVGIVILLIAYLIVEKLTPENSWKEIVENKNMALAIVFAAFIIGISLIISAALHG